MEGLILMGVYVFVAAIFGAGAVAIGFVADSMWAPISLIIFMIVAAGGLGLAWPIAVWLTRSWDAK